MEAWALEQLAAPLLQHPLWHPLLQLPLLRPLLLLVLAGLLVLLMLLAARLPVQHRRWQLSQSSSSSHRLSQPANRSRWYWREPNATPLKP